MNPYHRVNMCIRDGPIGMLSRVFIAASRSLSLSIIIIETALGCAFERTSSLGTDILQHWNVLRLRPGMSSASTNQKGSRQYGTPARPVSFYITPRYGCLKRRVAGCGNFPNLLEVRLFFILLAYHRISV